MCNTVSFQWAFLPTYTHNLKATCHIWTFSILVDCSTVGDSHCMRWSCMRDPTGELSPKALTSRALILHCMDILQAYIYIRTGFECVVKRLRMELCKPDCDSNECALPNGQATPCRSSAILRHERWVVFSLFTLLAWFPNSSRSNAAVTGWFTSIRMFGDSWAWLGAGGFTFDLKYQWTLILTIDNWAWFYGTVHMRICVEHLSKRG